MEHCKKLGSRSPPVRTLQEWQNVTKEIELLTGNKYNHDFWLALRLENNTKDEQSPEGVWRDYYTGEPLDNFTKPWMKHDDGGNFVRMTYSEIENETMSWQWNRNKYKSNPVGCLCQKTVLKLRGLCLESAFRSQTKLRGIQYVPQQCTELSCSDQSPLDSFFVGGLFTKIATENDKWKLTIPQYDVYAVSEAPESSYALGKHTWNIFNDECRNGSYKTKLKLTGCKDSEYTCDDGHCVRMTQRCDQIPNCKDGSDEEGCQLVVLNKGYNKDVPPFIMESYSYQQIIPVDVNVSIELFNVMSINEVENTIDLKFEIQLEWFDHRHTYNNLKENRFFLNALNETDLTRIWLPLIVYQNTDQLETTRLGWISEWSSSVMIIRRGNFER